MTVGERIKHYRLKRGMTQKELADKMGIRPVGISQYESGKRIPKPETIKRIAHALDINPYYLQEGKSLIASLNPDAIVSLIAKAAEEIEPRKPFNLQLFAEDERLTRLNENYDALNDHSRQRLVEYSDDLVSNPQNKRKPDTPEE